MSGHDLLLPESDLDPIVFALLLVIVSLCSGHVIRNCYMRVN